MKFPMITNVLLCAALAMGASAHAKDKTTTSAPTTTAKPAKGPSIGNASVDDVTLDRANANQIAFSTVNPMQYGGNTAGFASTFGAPGAGAWSVLGTVDGAGKLADSSSLFDFSFKQLSATTGTWTIKNTSIKQDATLDLTVAIHASNASTAFLFDNQSVAAGRTLSGNWTIEWLNNGGQVPAFSNLVFFGRDVATRDVTLLPVPEPGALPMMLAGFAVLGTAAWRRHRHAAK